MIHFPGRYSPLTDGWIPPKFSYNGLITSTSTTKTHASCTLHKEVDLASNLYIQEG